MKGHTGGMMSLGRGAIITASTKQKINTRSSTEAELVGVDDVMSKVLWTRYFIEAQGYNVKLSTIYQDNQSTILLENNGQASSKRTKHINVRYFFVTDRVKSKEVTIQYCPTKEMKADFFTKPLQGRLFYKLRAEVMNMEYNDIVDSNDNISDNSHDDTHAHMQDDMAYSLACSPQECVGTDSQTDETVVNG